MVDYYKYPCIALTGGGDGALDAIDGSLLKDGDAAYVDIPGTNKHYEYIIDADSAAAESSPDVISPDNNAGDKRWLLLSGEATYQTFTQLGTGAVARTSESKMRDIVSVKDFGAKGDGVTDDAASITAAIDYVMSIKRTATCAGGGTVYFPSGMYKISTALSLDRSADTDLGRVDLIGESQNSTWLDFTGNTNGIELTGPDYAEGGSTGSSSFQTIANFSIVGRAIVDAKSGIVPNLTAFVRLKNLDIQRWGYGIYAQDTDQIDLCSCHIRFNDKGVFARRNPSPPGNTVATYPNSWNLYSCNISSNDTYGVYIVGGILTNFWGGLVVSNGVTPSAGTGFGIMLSDPGYTGGVGGNFVGVYFEGNKGTADIHYDATGDTDAASICSVVGCSFARIHATDFVTNNILFTSGEEATYGKQVLSVINSSFKSFNDYTPDAGRKYIARAGVAVSKYNFYEFGNMYEDDTEKHLIYENLKQQFCIVGANNNQAISQNNWEAWGIDSYYGTRYWTPTISSNAVTMPEAGMYTISSTIAWNNAAAGVRGIRIYKNSTCMASSRDQDSAYSSISMTYSFAKNDAISLQVLQGVGANMNAAGAGTSQSYMTITKHIDT